MGEGEIEKRDERMDSSQKERERERGDRGLWKAKGLER